MSPKELEKATLVPFRLAHSLAREDGKIFHKMGEISVVEALDRSDIYKQITKSSDIEFLREILDGYLVPGGRFFVAVIDAEVEILTIWDLGPRTERLSFSWSTLATTCLGQGSSSHLLAIFPTSCGHGLRILLQTRPNVQHGVAPILRLYEIFPLQEQPTFRPLTPGVVLAEKRWIGYEAIYCHRGDRIVLQYPDTITVWDIKSDKRINFNIGRVFEGVCAIEDYILLFSKYGEVEVWQLPSTSDFSEATVSPSATQAFHLPTTDLPPEPESRIEHLLVIEPNSPETPKYISVTSRVNNLTTGRAFSYHTDLFEIRAERRSEDSSAPGLLLSITHLPFRDYFMEYAEQRPDPLVPEAGYKIGNRYIQMEYMMQDGEKRVIWAKDLVAPESQTEVYQKQGTIGAAARPRTMHRELISASSEETDALRGDNLMCPYSGRVVHLVGGAAYVFTYAPSAGAS